MLSIYYNSAAEPKNTNLQLIDNTGKVVNTINIGSNNATYMFPVINYKAGIYYVELKEDGRILKTEKVMVVH